MSLCIEEVMRDFPFPGYMEPKWHAYDTIARNCLRLLPVGARILDFGAGPCEKAAILSRLGYQCTAVDDLEDDWHQIGDNRDRLFAFARSQRVKLFVANQVPAELERSSFDMVMLHDIIEHFANSPRTLLVNLIELLRPGGYLYITVPNAVNLRKRLLVLTGQTNYPRYPAYFWSGDTWRGHKREYVKHDLDQLCKYLGLQKILLKGQHHRLRTIPARARWVYLHTVGLVDSLRDTLALIGQKQPDWKPVEMQASEYNEIRKRETDYQFAGGI
jgi:SAM-dependent methyltransferase